MNFRESRPVKVFLERSARGIALRIPVWYLFLCGLLYVLQTGLLFHPSKMTRAEWNAEAHRRHLTVLPETLALVAEPEGAVKGTVVVFHGNGESAMVRSGIAMQISSRGYRAVMAEYPGFGAQPGTPGRESILVAGRQLIAQLHKLYPGPLELWGESMGSGPASELASEEAKAGRTPDKLVLIVPYDKLWQVAQHSAPLFPVRLLLRHHFDNSDVLASYPGQIDIVVADADEVVGTDQGRQLRHNLADRAGHYQEIGSTHNGWSYNLPLGMWESLLAQKVASKLGS